MVGQHADRVLHAMKPGEIKRLQIGVRVYPESAKQTKRRGGAEARRWTRPKTMFVFDTETRVDATQRLTFGSYRFIDGGKCLEEGLFYADDLPPEDRAIIEEYARLHPADTDRSLGLPRLKVVSRSEYLKQLYSAAVDGRALLVGFNLPFDISRVAASAGAARGRFNGGFSFTLWQYETADGELRENSHRPRVTIKHIDSKRALKGFTSTRNPDQVDLIPEGSKTGKPDPRYGFRGHFLDLRTLAFALSDRGLTLESACEAFGVEHGKIKTEVHGIVTGSYIDYNRRDVQATTELALKLLEEFDRHPIALPETKAYSPASIGKSYLAEMAIRPILERQPLFPKKYLGYAQSAFYGGRTSAHIRKVPVPVVYCDFLSMYPTVNALMGLWQFVIAKRIRVLPNRVNEVRDFLLSITVDELFKTDTFMQLHAFVRVIPDGDVVPVRAKYSAESNDWQVGLNHLYAVSTDPNDGLWYALPDIVASVLLTGKIPHIVDAFRIEPVGQISRLEPVKLRGIIEIDPRNQDFFKCVIEERKRYLKRSDLPYAERSRLDKFIKVLANATSYGIYAQMDRQESVEKISVTCHGIDALPFQCRVNNPEDPGQYCFPPLASLITAAARLLLALLERCVTDLGGTYAMEDTDSMAVVATRDGGLVPCPGGPFQTESGQEAIRALTWVQVDQIAKRFKQLSPYDKGAIPGSILKIEDDNFNPATGEQRQLWCLAISAKRYTLFLRDEFGEPAILRKGTNNVNDRYSEHGLGHLLNPTDPKSEDRSWIAVAWLAMVRRSLGLATVPLGFEKRVAVGRITVSSPAVLKPLEALNAGKTYADRIKPFNFILSCHVRPFGHPTGADAERFHLIAPFETDPQHWEKLEWIDQYSGKVYKITTRGLHGSRSTARVKSYGEVLREYEKHPEAKYADATGMACGKKAVGLLQRRHMTIDLLRFIGKESNRLEEVEEENIADPRSVYTEYPDATRDEWTTEILPLLKSIPLPELQRKSGLSRAALQAIRAGRRPHNTNKAMLAKVIEPRTGTP